MSMASVRHAQFFLLLLLASSSPLVNAGSVRQPVCSSWKLNVEVNNLRGWSIVPDSCETYIASYITGGAYSDDSYLAVQQAIDYASSFNFTSQNASKISWIFDIDETSLSNVPYYERHHFGTEAYNDTTFEAWVEEGVAPALPATLNLYNKLKELGFYVFFLTGRDETRRNITAQNLQNAGYSDWDGLILRQSYESGISATAYKSTQRKVLEDLGYVLLGNIGDQWSDLTGYSTGERTFKLPNPLYYIS